MVRPATRNPDDGQDDDSYQNSLSLIHISRERAIVVHGAAYANPSVCKSGRLGRSFGCPALPQALTKPIINTIKGGSVLFIYANNKEYMAKSSILPNQTSQELFTEACESEQTVSAHL